MFKKFMLVLAVMLLFPLVLGVASEALAGVNPPIEIDGTVYRIVGPPIEAVLTASLGKDTYGSDVSVTTVVGTCKKNTEQKIVVAFNIEIPTTASNWVGLLMGPEFLENYIFYATTACFSDVEEENLLAISGVTKFAATEEMLGAEVAIYVLEEKVNSGQGN
jgi:hypothetical protein